LDFRYAAFSNRMENELYCNCLCTLAHSSDRIFVISENGKQMSMTSIVIVKTCVITLILRLHLIIRADNFFRFYTAECNAQYYCRITQITENSSAEISEYQC
jgi:hypothetical protein